MKRFIKFIILGTLLAFIVLPSLTFSQSEGEVKGDVDISALVPSKVCLDYSSFTSNVNEVLADLSQKVILTVKLHDCSGNPLADIPVEITSNRGDIDIVNNISVSGDVLVEGSGTGVVGYSNTNGFAYFEALSSVPGESGLSAKADNLVNFDQIQITFLPLPFPKRVSISIAVPSFIKEEGKIEIFKPKEDPAIDREKLVNTGVEIVLPFNILVAAVIIALLNIGLLVLISMQAIRIKKINNRELKLIEKEAESIDKEADYLKKEEAFLEKITKKSETIKEQQSQSTPNQQKSDNLNDS